MPDFRFDSFEVDESNRFAVALCKAVVNLEKGYSPLFIHGEPGSGKTHLLTAMSAELGALHPDVSRLYLSDQFPTEKMLSGQRSTDIDGNSEEFIYKAYSRKDILIVDDIERYSKDRKVRERFSTLLGAFVDNGKQVVLASSASIENLTGFDERILSRLRGGVDVSISSPKPETRLKILKRECERLGLTLSVDIMQLLMLEAGKDMQYLKKLSTNLKTFSTITRQKLSREKVEEFISIIQAEMGEEKRGATAEQVYALWVQSQARKREDDYTERISQLEEELARQKEHAQALEERLLAARPSKQESEGEVVELQARLKALEKQLKEKTKALQSQERLVASEIPTLTKRLQQQEKLVAEQKADHEKAISEKESRILELEQMLSRVSDNLTATADQEKRAAATIEALKTELDRVKKTSRDELLGLRIQLEKREEDLKLLGRERELSLGQHERSKSELERKLAEAQGEMLLLEKKIESQNARVAQLQRDLEKKTQDFSETESQLRAEMEGRGRLEAEVASVTRSLNVLKGAGEVAQANLKRALSESEAKLAKAAKVEAGLRHEIAALAESLEAERARAASAEQRCRDFLGAEADFKSQIQSVRAELEQARSEGAQLKQLLDTMCAERDTARQEIARLMTEASSLSQNVKEYESLIEGRDKEISRLNAKASELSKTLAKRERLLAVKEKDEAEQVRRLSEEIKERDARIRDLESELANQASRFSALSDAHETLNSRVEELSSEHAKLTEAKESLERELSGALAQANARSEEAASRASELESKLDASQATVSELESRLEQTRKATTQQIEELERTRSEAERLASEQKAALETKLEEELQEIQKLESIVSELNERIEGQTRLIEEKESEHADGVSKLQAQLAARDASIDELSKRLEGAEAELEHRAVAITELNEQTQKLRASMDSLVSEKKALEERLANVIEEGEARLNESESRLKQTRAALESAKEELAVLGTKLENERASSAELIQNLRAEAGRREKEFQQAKELLDQKLKSSQDQVEELKAMVESAEQRLEKQRLLIVEEGHENSRLAKLLEEKDRRIADLQKTMDSMQEDFLSQTHQDSETREKFFALQAELTNKENMLMTVRSDYCELEASLERLKSEAEHARKRAEQFAAENVQAQEREKSREETLERLKARAAELQKEKHQAEQNLLARTQELEKALTDRDLQIASLRGRLSETAEAATASLEGEMAGLKSRYERELASLKERLETTSNELREVRAGLEEAEALKRELAHAQREVEKLSVEKADTAAVPKKDTLAEVVAEAPGEPAEEAETEEAFVGPEPEPIAAETSVYEPRSRIQWEHAFEDFIPSDSNAFSIEMAEKIARNLAELYNPLCVYGPEGSGKTHILHAIGDLATASDPSVTTEFFSLDELFRLVQEDSRILAQWEDKLKLLFIDEFDVSGMPPNDQRRLHHFLKTLAQKKTQIVIASPLPPIKMGYLQEFMLRFLESGLLIRLDINRDIQEERKEAAEAIVQVARSLVESSTDEKEPESEVPESGQPPEPPIPEVKRDFLDEFLAPDPAVTAALFGDTRLFDELEEAFRNPNRKWRNKFPLLLIEDDPKLRLNFFHALGNRLIHAIPERVSLLSIEKLAEMLRLTPSFDWNGLLNKFARSRAVLVADCDNIGKLSTSALGYLRAIVEEMSSRDVLLLIGMSKRYKKEPVFGGVYKKASRKKL